MSSSERFERTLPPLVRASAFYHPHALVVGEIYTVINGHVSTFPPLPRDTMAPSNSPTLPKTGLHWIPNEHPFMFLVYVHPPFYAPLFDRLGFNEKNIPVTRIARDRFTLNEGLKTEWVSLERNLRAIVFAMAEICPVPLPKFFHFWAFPKRFGYELVYSTSRAVQAVASRSRDAFIPLMAAVTFLLIILNEHEVTIEGFRWREPVLKKTGIHHHWLSMLEESAVGDLSLARVGGVINMKECEYVALIPLLMKARLSIYLCWGNTAPMPRPRLGFLIKHHLVPSPKDIGHLRYLASHPPPPTSMSNSATLSPAGPLTLPSSDRQFTSSERLADDHTLTQVLPPVEKYSGQKEGEHWKDFFRRREIRNAERLSRETPKAKQSRSAKEKAAEQHHLPGRKGARVFIWEDVNGFGFRVRRAIGYLKYELLWSDYNRSQRKYDSFSDQWDVCTEFGDGGPDSDDDDEDDMMKWYYGGPSVDHTGAPQQEGDSGGAVSAGTSDNFGVPSELLPDTPQEPDHQEGEYSSAADLMRVHGGYEDGELPSDSLPNDYSSYRENFEDTAYYRFGFSHLASAEPTEYHVSWTLATHILGDGRWRDTSSSTPDPPQGVQNTIRIFMSHLWSSRDISSIPHHICDVWQHESDLWVGRRNLRVRQHVFSGVTHYFLRSWNDTRPDSAMVDLSITSAATLLEVFRRQLGPGLTSVAEFLINRGVTFHTFIPGPHLPPVLKTNPRYRGLGFRPKGYRPDTIDYQAYVSSRDRFLRTSRGRAALMAGGLVARFAKAVVPYAEVFYGPSDVVFNEGLCLWDGNSSSQGYWDDTLTEDELDLICGVYKIATGQYDAHGPQTTDISWWPKPSIWETSGLCVGYWSEDCEKWYQAHTEKCLAGTAPLRNPKDWRHSMRFTKDATRMAEKNELRGAEALKLLDIF